LVVPCGDEEVCIGFFVRSEATRLKVWIVRRVLKHPTLKRVRLVCTRGFLACPYEALNNRWILHAEKVIDCCGDLSFRYREPYDGIPKDTIWAG
jgi:phage pi2 protein 07